jgi:HEAT repeat protein
MTFPKIDLFSFWFGFILATVFWLVILRISRMLPKMKKSMADNRRKQEAKHNTSREHSLRVYMERKSQSNHIASALFPLDRVLIEPSVIAPPDYLPRLGEDESSSHPSSVLPYTPEVPDLYIDFPAQLFSIEAVASACQYFCLSGAAGAGKTTALSFLVSRFAENESKPLPLVIPARLFLTPETLVMDLLADYLATNIAGVSHESALDIVTQAAQNSNLLLTIEDLDELSRSEFDIVVERVKEFQALLPKAHIAVTSGTFYSGALEDAGFSMFTIAPWNRDQRTHFIQQWSNAFSDATKLEIQSSGSNLKARLDKTLLWLLQEETSLSPMEQTIKVWLSLANSLRFPQREKLYTSYLEFISDGTVNSEGFIAIAEALHNSQSISITREKIAESLNSRSDYIIRNDSKRLSTNDVIETLVVNNLFSELADKSLKFQHVDVAGYLNSQIGPKVPLPPLAEALDSTLAFSCLVNKASADADVSEFTTWLDKGDLPLYRNYLIGMNWLKLTCSGDQLRNEIFKRSARLLQDTMLPFGLRARFLAFLAQTQDPSILSLLSILKGNRDPHVRQLVALGYGMFADEKAVTGLAELTDDEITGVQNAAVLSLARLWTVPAQDALVNVIFSADEVIRSNACELLAAHNPDGYQMLKEIIATDNYLARKAAISGLRCIKEPWVRETLEKVSVEDTQWVVRDAAIAALDHIDESNEIVPLNWLPVHENPWTMEKAEEYHMELTARAFPSALLQSVFDRGSSYDRKTALHYLLSQPTPQLILQLNKISREIESPLRESALNALYSLGKRGLEVR